MMTISKSVGKNAHGQTPSDVKLVQTALGSCKCPKHKPFYKGRVDGKCGPKTIAAIEEFQCSNQLKVTGKIESYGPTINKLRQKTPMSIKNKLDKCGGGGHGAGGTLDIQKVINTNNRLAEEIKTKWPLPKKEAEDLASCVKAVSNQGMVPLKAYGQNPVRIDNAGRFTVKFAIEPWAYDPSVDGIPIRREMIKRVNKIIATKGAWHSGSPDNLSFKSAIAYPELKGLPKPSIAFLEFMELSTMPNDPIICAELAAIEKKLGGKNES